MWLFYGLYNKRFNKMSEIEKLYELAGAKYCDKCRHDSEFDCIYMCKIKYPPFTAEKQLELIKWLAFRDYITIVAYISGEYHSEHDKYNANEKSLEGCLARLINNFWQDLTEEEKAEIKRILENEQND